MKRYVNAAALTAATLGMILVSAAAGADVVIVGCIVEGSGCQNDCGKTVCRPVCETKTVVTRVYTSRYKDVCLPCCLAGLFDECSCGHVKKQKDLVVKLRKCDKCVQKCVPVTVPTCSTCAPACSAPCASSSMLHGTIIEGTVIGTMPAGPIAR